MKILVIQAGTPVNPQQFRGQRLLYEPTLTHGMQYFRYSEVVNNMQMRESLGGPGIQVDYVYFTGRKNIYNCIRAAVKVRSLCKKNGYHIVNQYWGGMGSFFIACLCSTTYVISFFGSDLYGRFLDNGAKTFKGAFLTFFSRLTAMFASSIVVTSESLKDELWVSTRHKATVICEGINPELFYPMAPRVARERLKWNYETPVVLFFPSEANVKNMPLAMTSFELLKSVIPDAQLMLVYNVAHAELLWHYNAADLLLITSYKEGSNNSIKEAIACNLPVVSVPAGDARERLLRVYPSTVVSESSPEKLSAAMIAILRHRQRSNGTVAMNGLSLESTAAKLLDHFYVLLQQAEN